MAILIIGAGVGGQGIAKYLGRDFYFVDDDPANPKSHFPTPARAPWREVTCAVVSGGVSSESPWLKAVTEQGIEVFGEAQFALERLEKSRLVAVTGTNGKTTLVLFAEHVLRSLGFDARACGNVGLSLGAFLSNPSQIAVVELSSFQLERIKKPCFESSVTLNITPDHLDWHGSMECYVKAKARLTALTAKGQAYITPQVKRAFGTFFPKDVQICEEDLIASSHALLAPFEITLDQIKTAHKSFKHPEHRLEPVATVDGIRFINDSKATNFAALSRAVRVFADSHLVLILSGIPKEASLESVDLSPADEIIVFGEMSALAPPRAHIVKDLEAAAHLAFHLAKGVVLFSPGGSSFDCFENYVDRGRQFKYTVEKVGVGL